MKQRDDGWISVIVNHNFESSDGESRGLPLLNLSIPFEKFVCQLDGCKKDALIVVADLDEEAALCFCSYAHLYEDFKGDER